MLRSKFQSSLPNIIFGLVALVVVAADQFSKNWIRTNLDEGQILLQSPLFRIDRVSNSGAAFGIFQGQAFPLTIASIVTTVIVLFYVFYLSRRTSVLHDIWGKATLGLILGGIVGNLIDRMFLGYVTDFIDFGWWPAFNIADAAVSVGGLLLAIQLIFSAVASERAARSS